MAKAVKQKNTLNSINKGLYHTEWTQFKRRVILPCQPENIPQELKAIPQWGAWVCQAPPTEYPLKSITKANKRTSEPQRMVELGSFENALDALSSGNYDGLVFEVKKGSGPVAVQFPQCRDPSTGEILKNTLDLVKRLGSYTEINPLGTSITLWGYDPHAIGIDYKGRIGTHVEGWLTLTGHSIHSLPLADISEFTRTISAQVLGDLMGQILGEV